MGSIATATIVLDDSLHVGYEHEPKLTHESAHDGGSDSDCSLEDEPNNCSDSCSDASTCEYNEVLSDNEDEQSDDHGQGQDHCKHCKCNGGPYWIKRGYGRRNGFGDDKILGGHNVLHSLSNATGLKLLADAGEVWLWVMSLVYIWPRPCYTCYVILFLSMVVILLYSIKIGTIDLTTNKPKLAE